MFCGLEWPLTMSPLVEWILYKRERFVSGHNLFLLSLTATRLNYSFSITSMHDLLYRFATFSVREIFEAWLYACW